MLRQIVRIMSRIKLLIALVRELTLVKLPVILKNLGVVSLLSCLVIHRDSGRTVLARRPSLTRGCSCILLRIAISAVSLHEFLTTSILRDWL